MSYDQNDAWDAMVGEDDEFDNIPENQEEQEDQEQQQPLEQMQTEEGEDGESYVAPEQFVKYATSFGIDVSDEQYKDAKMTQEQSIAELGRLLAAKHLENDDPIAAAALKMGVPVSEYRNHAMQFESALQQDDVNLGRRSLYIRYWQQEAEAGTLPEDQKAAQDHVIALVHAQEQRIGADKLKNLGTKHRAEIQQQYNQMSGALKQDQAARMQQIEEGYAKQRDSFFAHDAVKEYIKTGGFVPYAAEQEKKDFEQFAKENLSFNKDAGQLNFVNKFLSDGGFAMNVMRLAHMLETGRFNQQRNMPLSKAFSALDSMLETKGSGQKKRGNGTVIRTDRPH